MTILQFKAGISLIDEAYQLNNLMIPRPKGNLILAGSLVITRSMINSHYTTGGITYDY